MVWAGKDGKSDFDRLHSRAHDDAVFLYAFDLLEGCGSRNTWTGMVRRYSSTPAKWDWKVSSRSDGIFLIEAAAPKVG